MNPWWNLPFAVLVLLGLWCRLRGPRRLVGALAGLLGFFGADAGPDGGRRAAADLLAVSGVSGLLFVAWAGRLTAVAEAWLATDVVATSLGLGLVAAWLLSRLDREPGDGATTGRISSEMVMMDVDELPHSSAIPGRETPSSDLG